MDIFGMSENQGSFIVNALAFALDSAIIEGRNFREGGAAENSEHKTYMEGYFAGLESARSRLNRELSARCMDSGWKCSRCAYKNICEEYNDKKRNTK